MNNFMKVEFAAISENESFARVTVAAFIAQLDPTVEELTEIKTVVSEAVTNAIIHGYDDDEMGTVYLECTLKDREISLSIQDFGKGIEHVDEAIQPMYTSKPELERSGMGFTIHGKLHGITFEIESTPNQGTTVTLRKKFLNNQSAYN